MAKTLRLTEGKKDETSGSEKANRRRQAAFCPPLNYANVKKIDEARSVKLKSAAGM